MRPLSTSHASIFGDTPMTNGLDDYEILEQLGKGGASTVNLVICKRGRLRNRKLALKKIPKVSSPSVQPQLLSSASLHQALHHPSIVSLYSVFSTPTAHFHVLELCSSGSLFDLISERRPKVLTESQLRGVIKSVIDALVYLRKELIIHRDIKPSNILLTDTYTIKLSDFGLATRLSSSDSASTTFCGSPNYVAPEIVSRSPYDFTVDLWSVGCVMITCLTGYPPFDAEEVAEILKKSSQAAYTLPPDISSEASALIEHLLQLDPNNRIPLSQIVSHAFFTRDSSITPLDQCFDGDKRSHLKAKTDPPKPTAKLDDGSRPQLLPFPLKPTTNRGRVGYSYAPPRDQISGSAVLRDIKNIDLRKLLNDEVASSGKISDWSFGPTRRIVSDPVARHKQNPAHELKSFSSDTKAKASQCNFPSLRVGSFQVSDVPPTSSPTTYVSKAACCLPKRRSPSLEGQKNSAVISDQIQKQFIKEDQVNGRQITSQHFEMAIGTTRPSPFNTSHLSPRTHKISYGHIVILPSRSLLVDFREGQRRKGQKGDEVLLIDPCGTKVEIYSAPHLSTPCCLVEPTQQYALKYLPPVYWKQYNNAGLLVDQIKQRTPKLVLYDTNAKYTLMANGPPGDVELLILRSNSPHPSANSQNPNLRLRLSRQNKTIETAHSIVGVQGQEWTKKIISIKEDDPLISVLDSLDSSSLDVHPRLVQFLKICEHVEANEREQAKYDTMNCASAALCFSAAATDEVKTVSVKPTRSPTSSSGYTIANSLSLLHVAPRPAKLSSTCIAIPCSVAGSESDLGSRQWQSPGGFNSDKGFRPIEATSNAWCDEETELLKHQTVQTRFLPSVGWCIRHGSRVSQGGRYKIMFLDGVALDIDVDEEWAEFTSPSGDVVRHNIRECNSKRNIGERMKVFEEFVSLFDDS